MFLLTSIDKSGLSHFYVKRKVLSDGYSTAYLDFWISDRTVAIFYDILGFDNSKLVHSWNSNVWNVHYNDKNIF